MELKRATLCCARRGRRAGVVRVIWVGPTVSRALRHAVQTVRGRSARGGLARRRGLPAAERRAASVASVDRITGIPSAALIRSRRSRGNAVAAVTARLAAVCSRGSPSGARSRDIPAQAQLNDASSDARGWHRGRRAFRPRPLRSGSAIERWSRSRRTLPKRCVTRLSAKRDFARASAAMWALQPQHEPASDARPRPPVPALNAQPRGR